MCYGNRMRIEIVRIIGSIPALRTISSRFEG